MPEKGCLADVDSELFFYARVLGFPLADPVEPVAIDNF
jgi:hypothetical protein